VSGGVRVAVATVLVVAILLLVVLGVLALAAVMWPI
jgi:hypothetical protein